MVPSSVGTCLESMVILGVLRVTLDFIVMDVRKLGNASRLVALVSLQQGKNLYTFDSVTL